MHCNFAEGKGGFGRRTFLKSAGAAAALAGLAGCGAKPGSGAASSDACSAPEASASSAEEPASPRRPMAMRAMWLSYLEWQTIDFSSRAAFAAAVGAMFENCVLLGLNTVFAQVRPFGDALYKSSLYPWSHLCGGVQGTDPGFDPLDVLVTEAHTRGLSLEAWLNPYRLRLRADLPAELAADNLAATHPEWVVAVKDGLYLNPALPEAADYVAAGVREIVENYAVDGIHFDDYFYPTTEGYVDEAQFAASGASGLDTWRRENVTAMVKKAYAAVKTADPTLRFGISPQGNPDNNMTQQYSDVAAWMTAAGSEKLVDYICPQVYWGYHFTLSSGTTRFAFEKLVPEWLAMPRAEDVALYFGLGAWRIGDGDGGKNEDSVTQWNTGENLAAQIADLAKQEADGYALYRYGSLYASAYPETAAKECAGIAALNATLK